MGRVLVDEFVKDDAKVCFTYRNSLEKAREIEEKYKDNVVAIKSDALVFDEAVKAVEVCIKTFGKIDILVNNAASAKDGSLEKITEDKFEYTIKNVLYPVFNYSKAVSFYFIKNMSGKLLILVQLMECEAEKEVLPILQRRQELKDLQRQLLKN